MQVDSALTFEHSLSELLISRLLLGSVAEQQGVRIC